MRHALRRASTAASAAIHPVDPPVLQASLRRGRIGYTDEPAGHEGAPTLVCLHGGPGSVYDFRYIGGAVAGRARVVRFDLPGHGTTAEGVAASPSTASAAAAAEEAGEGMGVWGRGTVVVGHSLGAHVAMELAARMGPSRVGGVCLLCPVSLRPHQAVRPQSAVRLIHSLLQLPGVGPSVIKPLVWLLYTRVLGFNPRRTSADEAAFTMRQVAALDFERAAANADAIRETGVPCMVAWALDDPILEPHIAEELAGRLGPGPRLAFDHGGHYINKTHAADVVEAALGMMAAGGPSRL